MKLSEISPSPRAKAEALAYAALSLNRQKKYDDAIALAKTIAVKDISISNQIDIMFDNKRFKEIVDTFKDEDTSNWNDTYSYNFYYKRGMAYRILPDLKNAEKNFEKALECAGTNERHRIIAMSDLGDVYSAMKEEQKALDAYGKASAMKGLKGTYSHYNSVICSARILSNQGKSEEALKELGKVDVSAESGVWGFLTLEVHGDIYMKQGKEDEAAAKYKEALGFEKVSPVAFVDRVKKKLESIN
jgi:predicted negative regulator of RcsB-dependent stress response